MHDMLQFVLSVNVKIDQSDKTMHKCLFYECEMNHKSMYVIHLEFPLNNFYTSIDLFVVKITKSFDS